MNVFSDCWNWCSSNAATVTAFFAATASVVAYMTYRQEKKNTAMTQVAEYIESITTGDLARDRDVLEVWNRGSRRKFADDARRAYFNLLWALQRSVALKSHVKKIDSPLTEVLLEQLNRVIKNVNRAIGKAQNWDGSESRKAARESLDSLRGAKKWCIKKPLKELEELKEK